MSIALFAALGTARAEEQKWRSLPLIEQGRVAEGWKQIGWGEFVVDGDTLRTKCDPRGLGLLLYDQEKFGDCQIRIVFKTEHERSNSGVHIRMDDGILDWRERDSFAIERRPDGSLSDEMEQRLRRASEERQAAWYAVHHGYEIQICDTGDEYHVTGAVYSLAPTTYKPPKHADRWRTMVVTLEGDLVLIEIDGEQVTRFDPENPDVPPQKEWYEPSREPKRPMAGYFGLQTHDPADVVYFKEVSVRPLR